MYDETRSESKVRKDLRDRVKESEGGDRDDRCEKTRKEYSR